MDQRVEQAVFCLSADVPQPTDGVVGEALSGRIIGTGTVRQACSIRRLSAGGAVLHLPAPVRPAQYLSLELAGGRYLSGTVTWCSGYEAVLRFDEELDVLELIAGHVANQPGERRRLPRIELRLPVRVQIAGRQLDGVTRDLSQGGLKAELSESFEPGAECLLTLPGLPAQRGALRWTEGGLAGFEFERELPWHEVMPWLRSRASLPPAANSLPTLPHLRHIPVHEGPEPAVELNIAARVREGLDRWSVTVVELSATGATFESASNPRLGTSVSVVLPGLEGWPARVTWVEGYRWACQFNQPLHPAVLENLLSR